MSECPSCGEQVSGDSDHCPVCETQLLANGGQTQEGKRQETEIEWRTRIVSFLRGNKTAQASEHRLVIAGVLSVGLLGSFRSSVLIYSLTVGNLTNIPLANQFLLAGSLGLLAALTTLALTGYYYRRETLDRLYFWSLVGIGTTGPAFNLWLTPLIGLGIYGVVGVLSTNSAK